MQNVLPVLNHDKKNVTNYTNTITSDLVLMPWKLVVGILYITSQILNDLKQKKTKLTFSTNNRLTLDVFN